MEKIQIQYKLQWFLCILLSITSFEKCKITELRSPPGKRPVILALRKTKCKTVGSFARWYLLFGAFPLNKLNKKTLFPYNNRTYIIREKARAIDLLVTFLGGWAITLTRKTITVEACREDILITNKKEIEERQQKTIAEINEKLEADVQNALNKYAVRASKIQPGNLLPIIILKSGKSYRGTILQISEEQIMLRVYTAPESNRTGNIPVKQSDKIVLINGRAIYGTITSQSSKEIIIQTKSGIESYKKNKIKKVLYNTKVDMISSFTHVKKSIPRSQIRKIVFPQGGK